MEGLDVINVSEDGLFLAADVRWSIRAVSVLLVVRSEEFHLLDKLGFSVYQVLHQLAV